MTEPPESPSGSGRTTMVIAHRGASGYAPEHTWPAYELAMEMGADFLEPDLQMTRDGHLVAFHDPTLDRTARPMIPDGGPPPPPCTGLVRDRTLAEIRRCDVGGWFNERYPERARPEYRGQQVVTLAELFERWGDRVRWYPETKNPSEAPGMEEALLSLLDRHDLREAAAERGQVLIQSFSPDSLRHLRSLDPALPLVQLLHARTLEGVDPDPLMERISGYSIGVGVERTAVDARLLSAARRANLLVHVWTVDDPAEMRRLVDLGVDGIFTNVPDRLRTVLTEAPPRPPQ